MQKNQQAESRGAQPSAGERYLDIPSLFRREYQPTIYGYCNSFVNEDLCLQEFTYSMIFGNFNKDNLTEILQIFNLPMLPNVLMLLHVEGCDYAHDPGPSTRYFPVKLNICSAVANALRDHGVTALCSPISNADKITVFLCLNVLPSNAAEYRDTLSEIARLILQTVTEKTAEKIAIGISKYCPNFSRFTMAYEECKIALDKLFTNEQEPFQFFQELPDEYGEDAQADLSSATTQLVHVINSLQEEALPQMIADIIASQVHLDLPASRIKLNLVSLINQLGLYYANLGLKSMEIEGLEILSIQRVLGANFVSSVEKIVLCYCRNLIKNLNLTFRSSEAKLKFFVDYCFERMYMDPEFTLYQMAEASNYNPCYLGRLFKKIYGRGFSQYLSEFRIEKAKKLLEDTELNVAEISECVGFRNTSYFCTIFKRVAQKSPKQFRQDLELAG